MFSRRELLRNIGFGTLASSMPVLSLANADTDVRLVLVILRGAVDGLAIAAPYGDGNYRKVRGELAMSTSGTEAGLLPLDAMFGLHRSLRHTFDRYQQNEALVVHAVASPYRERSHFDGQDVLETGSNKASRTRDGWLNRAIGHLGGGLGNESAIALAQNTPLVLRGDNSVTSWAPSRLPDANEDTLRRIAQLYENDEFFATRFAQALESQDIAASLNGMDARSRNGEFERWKTMAASAAKFLTAPNGPRVAVMEAGGWDTHANQGAATGALANRLAALDSSLHELRTGLGNEWSNTVVAVVTEFGRTVSVNGTRGTDHGTGSATLLLGGAIQGGRVIADWPGLANKNLFQGRDLFPTTDIRSIFKGFLIDHLQIPDNFVEREVFADSLRARPMRDLIRTT